MRRILTAILVCISAGSIFAQDIVIEEEPVSVLPVVAEALSFLGTPYVYGGMDENGVDCSGLIYAIYKKRIPWIPRTARDLWERASAVEELQTGDLVFFNTLGTGLNHVGFYIGDNKFVHAASAGPETGVIVSSLDENYYKERYIGAKRLEELMKL